MFAEGGIKIKLKDFQPIHDKCVTDVEGINRCNRVYDDEKLGYLRCLAYINPSYWWDHIGSCPLASHVHGSFDSKQKKVRIGQQKQGKWKR